MLELELELELACDCVIHSHSYLQEPAWKPDVKACIDNLTMCTKLVGCINCDVCGDMVTVL